MNFDDICNRFAIEYATINNIKNIKNFDDLSEYHQAKVSLLIDKKIGIPKTLRRIK